MIRTFVTHQHHKTARTSVLLQTMANFLDTESGPDFINISSTSEDTDRAVAQAAPRDTAANAPAPPQLNVVGVYLTIVVLPFASPLLFGPGVHNQMLLLTQVQLDPALDDAPVVE